MPDPLCDGYDVTFDVCRLYDVTESEATTQVSIQNHQHVSSVCEAKCHFMLHSCWLVRGCRLDVDHSSSPLCEMTIQNF